MTDMGGTGGEEILSPEIVEAMGISQPAFEEVQGIIGRMPTVQELSTLLAMWDANGRQQSLYGWLKGQHHLVERHEYLYDGPEEQHKDIREPKVRECIALAHEVVGATAGGEAEGEGFGRGELLYMVGRVATGFLNSAYARQCLHIVDDPVRLGSDGEEEAYLDLILESLREGGVVSTKRRVGQGGLFASLVEGCRPRREEGRTQGAVGFDVLTCREVRLDAFLFGEEGGRYVASLPESQDDLFLLKLTEARVNCCFLGHVTKGRVLVDDMDFGHIGAFLSPEASRPSPTEEK